MTGNQTSAQAKRKKPVYTRKLLVYTMTILIRIENLDRWMRTKCLTTHLSMCSRINSFSFDWIVLVFPMGLS